MKNVFVDTSGFYAALASDDRFHSKAKGLFRRAEDEGWILVTSSYVVHEAWALIQGRLGWDALDAWKSVLLPRCEIIWVDEMLHALGAARCHQARKRKLSLTDCVSFEIMSREQIGEAIADDEDFEAAGIGVP